MDEIYRVLAPGGWVQLIEGSHCKSGEATQRHFAMLRDLFVKRGLLLDCVEHIPNILKDAGFDQVKAHRYEISLWGSADEDGIGAKARKNFVGVYKAMQAPIVAMGIRTEGEFREIMEDLEKEWENDTGARVILYTFVAQKPSTLA